MHKDLLKMGYREITPNVWAKPVGMCLFTFETEKLKFTNWFMGRDSTYHIWNTAKFDESINEFLLFLKESEKRTRITVGEHSSFDFLTLQDKLQAGE